MFKARLQKRSDRNPQLKVGFNMKDTLPLKLKADLIVIGDGVAGLALSYLASRRDIRTVVLGKNFKGTTQSATGLIAPRPDYLVSDSELVQRTSFECLRWLGLFYPQILKPRTFLMPVGPELPHSIGPVRALFTEYDRIAKTRGLPGHRIVSPAVLEKMEPNLRRSSIKDAVAFSEWTVDPAVLLKKLGRETLIYSDMVKMFRINEFKEFSVRNSAIEFIWAIGTNGEDITVRNDRGPLLVVNAAGPWMKDVCARLGVNMDYRLKAGVQLEIPGWYFQSGIVTFGADGKYVICLQKNGVLQVGPTNSDFEGHPDRFVPAEKEIGYLRSTLANLLEDKNIPEHSGIRWGFRVKPTAIDTNRPVIWNHGNAGLANLYSLHPGKMALALLAGDEMLDRAITDGWLPKPRIVLANRLHLDGNQKWFNETKLLLLKLRAWFKTGLFYIKFVLKTP